MIGIAICTHSEFASGLHKACDMIMGSEQDNLVSLGFTNDDELIDFSERLKELTADFTDGCIFVVDLVNASPFNAALLCIAHTDNIVISGVSLPMMLQLLTLRNTNALMADIAKSIENESSQYVQIKTSADVFE